MGRTYLHDKQIIADNTSAYSTEPVSVDELKNYLQIEGDAYNSTLAIFIKSSRKKIENYCNVSLVPKVIIANYETCGISGMDLPFPPIDAVTSVEWKKCPSTWLTLDTDDYDVIGNTVTSSEIGRQRINYITVPPVEMDVFRMAILMQAGYMYTQRDLPNGADWNPQAKGLIDEERNLVF